MTQMSLSIIGKIHCKLHYGTLFPGYDESQFNLNFL